MHTWESVVGWAIKYFDIVPLDVWSRRYNVATFVAEVSELSVAMELVLLTAGPRVGTAAAVAGTMNAVVDDADDGDAVKYWVANPIDLESQTHSTRSVAGFMPCFYFIFLFIYLTFFNLIFK